MKFKVEQAGFRKAIEQASKFIEARPSVPVLANVLISAGDDGVTVTSWDYSRISRYRTTIPAQVSRPGRVTVSADLLGKFIKRITADSVNVDLEASTNTLLLNAGTLKVKIKGISADEFPADRDFVVNHTLVLETAKFSTLINKVSYCAAKDDNRPALTGIYFDVGEDYIETAAADGYRLGVMQFPITSDDKYSFLIPKTTLTDIVSIMSGDMVVLKTGDDITEFLFENTNVLATHLDAKFPPFRSVIPKDRINVIELRGDEFLHELQTAAIFSADSANSVRVSLSEDSGSIQAQSQEFGESISNIAVKAATGSITGSFNVTYIAAAVEYTAGTTDVVLEAKENPESNPLFVRPAAASYPFCIVMPLAR